ncbi:hypothetical protein G6F46_015740 [Rhizopus delemar]|nr:hypothetical protein G6F46_015740 [Rhizopus delemar]
MVVSYALMILAALLRLAALLPTAATVGLLEERGTSLGFPHSSGINGSKHEHMRELRTQAGGHPLRTL